MMKSLHTLLFMLLLMSATLFGFDSLRGGGASLPAPLFEELAPLYKRQTHSFIDYKIITTQGGVGELVRSDIDFAASETPLNKELITNYRLYQFPFILSAVDVVHSLKIPDGHLNIKNETLAKIFMGEITYWDATEIQGNNPSLTLPHKKIIILDRTSKSNITRVFTEFLDKSSTKWHQKFRITSAISNPAIRRFHSEDALFTALKRTPYAITYVSNAHKVKHHFCAITPQSRQGLWVRPTSNTIHASATTVSWIANKHFKTAMVLSDGPKSYPIVYASYIILNRVNERENERVVAFIDWFFNHGKFHANALGYSMLPNSVLNAVRGYWHKKALSGERLKLSTPTR